MHTLIVSVTLTTLIVITFMGCGTDNQNTSNTGSNRNSSNTNQTINRNQPVNNGNSAMNTDNSNVNRTAVVQDNFWTNAAQGGLAEVEMGKLASTKATNPEVKKFAQKMVTDHTKANDELKTLAAKKNMLLPAEVSSGQKSMMDKLNGLSGADFDKAYIDGQVSDHEATVKLFEDQAKDDSDAELKAFAAKTLPIIKGHLEMIKGMQAKMK